MTEFIVIIPARLKSSRLDEKLLKIVNNKPLLYFTFKNALNSGAKEVIIATDSQKIVDVMSKFGARCVLTSDNHISGTSRIAEVVKKEKIDKNTIIVNLQGDEPLLPSSVISQVANNIKNFDTSTICEKITSKEQYLDSNCVKVVFDNNNKALYFSRSPIPYFRDEAINLNFCYRHIGIYAYRASFVEKYLNLKVSNYELIEKLEQLTTITNGFNIGVSIAVEKTGIGVDTQNDLNELRQILA